MIATPGLIGIEERTASCPKRMIYGPCGGVRTDGVCELGDRPCSFLDAGVVRWAEPAAPLATPVASPGSLLDTAGPIVVTDLRVRPFDLQSVRSVAKRLAPSADALLVGEHRARPDFPPTVLAAALLDVGARPWVTLSCRERNAVVLEADVAALAALGVEGVHCVTGDLRQAGTATATQVFDLDAHRLTALARAAGLVPSVAATPLAPPAADRPGRLAEKERAGAQLCFVNHAGGPRGVAAFIDAARATGVTMPFIACVAVFTDAASATVLREFPGVHLEAGVMEQVLNARDPVQAGIDAAVAQATAMLAMDEVVGVNLSGSATAGPVEESAAIMAAVGEALRSSRSAVRS